MLRLLLGDVAGVIATGQRVVPAKALALGYSFKYPQLADALRELTTPVRPAAEPLVHAHAPGAGHIIERRSRSGFPA